MTYRFFIVVLILMLFGSGGYYLFQEKGIANDLIANKKETSDLLNDQIRLVSEDNSLPRDSDRR